MKINLTPELSYVIGLWKARRTSEGVGISGTDRICGIFLEQVIKLKLAEPNKIQLKEEENIFVEQKKENIKEEKGGAGKEGILKTAKEGVAEVAPEETGKKRVFAPVVKGRAGNKVFFYHSAYRAFFDKVLEDRLERFKYKNEFAAQYLAGVFDGVGGIGKTDGALFFEHGDREDEMLLLRLDFRVKKVGRRIIVIEKEKFLEFVKPYLKFLRGC